LVKNGYADIKVTNKGKIKYIIEEYKWISSNKSKDRIIFIINRKNKIQKKWYQNLTGN
jgi:alkyl hydroperoxide reductase subunit AhpC